MRYVPSVVLTLLAVGLGRAGAQRVPATGSALESAAEMVVVPAGQTIVGDDAGEPDERPRRRIELPAFALDRTEVTAGEYGRCVAAGRCLASSAGPAASPNLPATGVSFTDASSYCAAVGKRLPSEPEWEKAARGTDGRRYPWGQTFDCARGNFGNFAGDGRCADDGAPGRPVAVGRYGTGASPYGALDMAGNVWEWVDGRYDYRPLGRAELRVLRGGGCCSIFGLPRSSDRIALPLTYRDIDIGFRCARSLAAPASSGPAVRRP